FTQGNPNLYTSIRALDANMGHGADFPGVCNANGRQAVADKSSQASSYSNFFTPESQNNRNITFIQRLIEQAWAMLMRSCRARVALFGMDAITFDGEEPW